MKKWIFLAIISLTCAGAATSVGDNTLLTKPIAHRNVLNTRITDEELRLIYSLSMTRWDDGQKIVVVELPPGNTLQRRFLWDYLGITSARHNEIVNAKVNDGKTRPTIVNTESEMISYVGKTPGSIGFVGSRRFADPARNVKVIKITYTQ